MRHGKTVFQRLKELRFEAHQYSVDEVIHDVLDEVESLRAFKRGVDEALNSGDGSYRP